MRHPTKRIPKGCQQPLTLRFLAGFALEPAGQFAAGDLAHGAIHRAVRATLKRMRATLPSMRATFPSMRATFPSVRATLKRVRAILKRVRANQRSTYEAA
jgi:hypothetical protein